MFYTYIHSYYYFQDHRAAFKSKTTWEVVRALVVFQLCGVKILVSNNEMVEWDPLEYCLILLFQFMKIGKKVLGKTLFASLMKPTFYGQFVAGEVSHHLMFHVLPTLFRMPAPSRQSLTGWRASEWRASWTTAPRRTSARTRPRTWRWREPQIIYLFLKKFPLLQVLHLRGCLRWDSAQFCRPQHAWQGPRVQKWVKIKIDYEDFWKYWYLSAKFRSNGKHSIACNQTRWYM